MMYQITVKDPKTYSTTRLQFGCRDVAETVRGRLMSELDDGMLVSFIEEAEACKRGDIEQERAMAIMRQLYDRVN